MRWLPCLLLAACGSPADAPDAAPTSSPVGPVEAAPQREGDPGAGYTALVNEPYVRCGVPAEVYDMFFGPAPEDQRLPGREGRNAELSYDQTAFVTDRGVEVITTNCLVCHAGRINGELVIGLGAADIDFTQDASSAAWLAGQLLDDGTPAREEWQRWYDRVLAISPYTITATVGVNPADNLAAVLFAHHDQETLAWSNEPYMDPPPAGIVVPVDVPPWWRMKKKHAMFYGGAGRGDHARLMMSAAVLCTDSVDEAREIDAYFPDIRAYIASLEPPPWPWAVDESLAAAGRGVYEDTCATCHGTPDAYPNLIVALDEVGTDGTLALGSTQFAAEYVAWFNGSFFGEVAHLAPAPGYYAPPLDGVWATAPYLHNGSVPTLAALLESSTRPSYWTRSFDSSDYDPAAVGWRFTALDHGHADEPDADAKKLIYDTTLLGYGNGGHTYGDPLSVEQRVALLEYLKTL